MNNNKQNDNTMSVDLVESIQDNEYCLVMELSQKILDVLGFVKDIESAGYKIVDNVALVKNDEQRIQAIMLNEVSSMCSSIKATDEYMTLYTHGKEDEHMTGYQCVQDFADILVGVGEDLQNLASNMDGNIYRAVSFYSGKLAEIGNDMHMNYLYDGTRIA